MKENSWWERFLQRKNFLIKPELQLKYLGIVLLLIFLTAGLVILFVNLTVSSSSKLEGLTFIDIVIIKDLVIKSVIFVVVVVAVIITLIGVLFLHRLAGPVFVLEKVIKMVSEGDLSVKLQLRKNDELQFLAEEFQRMVLILNESVSKQKEIVKDIKEKIEVLANQMDKIQDKVVKDRILDIKNALLELEQIYSKYKL